MEEAWHLTPGELSLLEAGRRVLDDQTYERDLALAWWQAALFRNAQSGGRFLTLSKFLESTSPTRLAASAKKASRMKEAVARKIGMELSFANATVEMEERAAAAARRAAAGTDES